MKRIAHITRQTARRAARVAVTIAIALGVAAPVAACAHGMWTQGGHSLSLFREFLPPGRLSALNVLHYPTPGNEARSVAERPQAKGYILLVHGGGWVFTGFVDDGTWWNHHGYATYSIDYRAGAISVADTIAAYDHLRRLVGPAATICADGQSAGGTLVMLLAAARPTLDCVISEAGIADIPALARQCAYRHTCASVTPAARIAFDYHGQHPHGLWNFSPLRVVARIHVPLLMAGSTFDACVDEPAQMSEMKHARPQTITMLLQGTPVAPWNFTHASVTPQALARFQAEELTFVAHAPNLANADADAQEAARGLL